MTLAPDQKVAMRKASSMLRDNKQLCMSLVGAAGSGKTYMVEHIVRDAKAAGYDVVLSALTHPAATVLRLASGRHVDTLHHIMGARVVDDINTGESGLVMSDISVDPSAPPTLVIVEEASMTPNRLVKGVGDVVRRSNRRVKVLWVGDDAQLPPPREPSSLVVDQARAPWAFARLETIHRQAEGNPIIDVATAIRTGRAIEFNTKVVDGAGVVNLSRAAWRRQFLAASKSAISKGSAEDFVTMATYTNDYAHTVNAAARLSILGVNAAKTPFVIDEHLILGGRALAIEDVLPGDAERVLHNGAVVRIDKLQFYSSWRLVPARMQKLRSLRYVKPLPDFPVYVAEVIVIGGALVTGGRFPLMIHAKGSKARDSLLKDEHGAALRRAKQGVPGAFKAKIMLQNLLADARHTHASTTHKLQGRTIRNVFCNMADMRSNRNHAEYRQLLYVAVTRASHRFWST